MSYRINANYVICDIFNKTMEINANTYHIIKSLISRLIHYHFFDLRLVFNMKFLPLES